MKTLDELRAEERTALAAATALAREHQDAALAGDEPRERLARAIAIRAALEHDRKATALAAAERDAHASHAAE